MSEDLGQPVVIENRPGAGGVTGTDAVVRSKPDGYTVVLASPGIMATNPLVYPNHPFDPETDLVAIHGLNGSPSVIVVNAERPYKTLEELVAFAKENPGSVKFASGGNGTASHLAGELFQQIAGVKFTHIPYKGSAPAMNDTVSGTVDLIFDYPVSTKPLVDGGQVRALAIMAPERVQVMPDVPAVGELGYGDAVLDSWSGLFAPKGTPQEIIAKLSASVSKALKDPAILKTFDDAGRTTMSDLDATTFPAFVHEEIVKWSGLAKKAGVTTN
jgi:tripartite-type tricarboxylate transporter receptor subunit TctC